MHIYMYIYELCPGVFMIIITLFLSQSSDKNLTGKKRGNSFCNDLELNYIGFAALKDEFKSITGK